MHEAHRAPRISHDCHHHAPPADVRQRTACAPGNTQASAVASAGRKVIGGFRWSPCPRRAAASAASRSWTGCCPVSTRLTPPINLIDTGQLSDDNLFGATPQTDCRWTASGKAPSRTAAQLVAIIRVAGTPLADWFKERSLSRWAEGIRDSINLAVRAGWQRDEFTRKLAIGAGSAALAAKQNGIENLTAV